MFSPVYSQMRSIAAFMIFLLPSKVSFWEKLLDFSSKDFSIDERIIGKESEITSFRALINYHYYQFEKKTKRHKQYIDGVLTISHVHIDGLLEIKPGISNKLVLHNHFIL